MTTPPVLRGYPNLYVKDLATGRIALLSRTRAGAPIHQLDVQAITHLDADYTGRYLVFASNVGSFDTGVVDQNGVQDVFWLDLDPDGDLDYLDTPPAIRVLSVTAGGAATGNAVSTAPTITQDGRMVAFLTRATDLIPNVVADGTVYHAVFVILGRGADGAPDPMTRTLLPVDRMGAGAATLTPSGVRWAVVDPWAAAVAFVTADDLPGTGDQHVGEDIYVVRGLDQPSSTLVWMSAARPTTGLEQLSAAWDPGAPSGTLPQVGWLARTAPRTVTDFFVQRAASPFPPGLDALNWPDIAQPSEETAAYATLSADGRFAWWITNEAYGIARPGTANLYRRAIAPAQAVTLTVAAQGGVVDGVTLGKRITGAVMVSATTTVELRPMAAIGYRFARWEGVDARVGMTATVVVFANRTVTATFVPMTPPLAAHVTVTTSEDTPLPGLVLPIVDPDPDEAHTCALVDPPAHGRAAIRQNMVDYVPAVDYAGLDTFTLQVTDAYGLYLAEPARVTVVVTPVNDPPRAASAAGQGANIGAGIALDVHIDDPDVGDAFTLTVTGPPRQGSAAPGVQGQLVYTPTAAFRGVDHFGFTATDRAGASIGGTATITVTAPISPTQARALYLPTLLDGQPP